MNINERVTEMIGSTPLMRLKRIEKRGMCSSQIIAKLEYFNPGGSAKDRVGYYMIVDAEQRKVLKGNGVIIEPTSGNTGVGLAMTAASRGYRTIIVMPENMSEERKRLMKAYGAELVLTPAEEGMKGAIAKAEELQKEIHNSIIMDQFNNPANAKIHYLSTGPVIW